jgi:uncharacterized protein YkwD
MGAGVLSIRGRLILLLVAGALAVALLGAGSEPARAGGGGGCAHAGDTHADATLKQLRDATVCVINRERGQRDRPRLDASGKLRKAAVRHTRVMLRTDCLDHRCPGEPGLRKRIKKTGYLEGATRWHFAESTGCKNTPRGMVKAWMAKRFHRRNLLKGRYREIGVGPAGGSPEVGGCKGSPDLTTYTALFAFRRP